MPLDSHAHDATDDGRELLFVDPMTEAPLAIYIDMAVPDRDRLVKLVTDYGGIANPSYSSVSFMLVNPHSLAGQNLFKQYSHKKGKIVLDARWVDECIRIGCLQDRHTNWAGCKVTGTEQIQAAGSPVRSHTHPAPAPEPEPLPPLTIPLDAPVLPSQPIHSPRTLSAQAQAQMISMESSLMNVAPANLAFNIYPTVQTQSMSAWTPSIGIAPYQTSMVPPTPQTYYRTTGALSYNNSTSYNNASAYDTGWFDPPVTYDSRYAGRWETPEAFPPAMYEQGFITQQQISSTNYVMDPVAEVQQSPPSPPPPLQAAPAPTPVPDPIPEPEVANRGRKRSRNDAPAVEPSSLVEGGTGNRSPTPPTRVVTSTYGGNLFTTDDILYLKKYVEYCQSEGLVLSLREICERLAVKAPHHTFYSWRRFCNKYKIRLGGYTMRDRTATTNDTNGTAGAEDNFAESVDGMLPNPMGLMQDSAAGMMQGDVMLDPQGGIATLSAFLDPRQLTVVTPQPPPPPAEVSPTMRSRSPTPPRVLFRSTAGKGIAFTEEDIRFLTRFMAHRRAQSQGELNMVAFWTEVVQRAPHHSRSSWMKFWRRHKDQLDPDNGSEPLPGPPSKKLRYSRQDDVLLSRFFYYAQDGSSDQVFQRFARMHPHHPWKGWQEHYRLHKLEIDELVAQFRAGGMIDDENAGHGQ